MKRHRAVLAIGVIELLIGGLTLLATIGSLLLETNRKSPNVLLFVLVTASLSTFLGIEILRHKKVAYQLLLYFSSVVVLSKLLIFMNIIQLNGALEIFVPDYVKSSVSIVYHLLVIYYLTRDEVKNFFYD